MTLELGGKSPVIVGKGADIAQASERVALGKMLNAGQICLAPDYVLASAAEEPRVVEGLKKAASAMYPTLLTNPDYTSVINDRHHQRLQEWLEDARAKGAQIEAINPAGEDFGASNSRKMPLHVVRDVTDDMIIMQEEIFGPILPIVKYDGIDDAIARVNRRARPLGLYYFGPDKAERRRVLERTISGGVTLDDVVFHVSMEDLPFGGIGPSGMGSYHGQDGFRTFSHAQSGVQAVATRHRQARGAQAAVRQGDANLDRAPDEDLARLLRPRGSGRVYCIPGFRTAGGLRPSAGTPCAEEGDAARGVRFSPLYGSGWA